MDRFERASDLPIYWRNCSTDLKGAAAALWCAITTEHGPAIAKRCGLGEGFSLPVAATPVYEMLCGMSLELIFKAIVVARDGVVAHNHRLTDLADAAKIELSEDDRGLLAVLSQAVYWEGRYPVPSDPKHWEETTRLRLDHLTEKRQCGGLTVTRYEGVPWDRFDALWGRADQVYWRHHRDRPLPSK